MMLRRALLWLAALAAVVVCLSGCACSESAPTSPDDAAISADASSPDSPLADGGADANVTTDATPGCSSPGALDPTFGDGGVAVPFLPGKINNAQAVVIEPNTQRILIGGTTTLDSALQACVVTRLLPSGAYDPTFGIGGVALGKIDGWDCSLDDIALQDDGKIVGVGSMGRLPEGSQGVLVRFDADGRVDTTFGAAGFATFRVDSFSQGWGVAIDARGRIVVAAQSIRGDAQNESFRYLALRYLSDGTLDPSFGTNGYVVTTFGGTFPALDDIANDVVIQSDGRILVVGGANPEVSVENFGAIRFDDDGTRDPTYGVDGGAMASFGVGATANGVALDSLGRAVLVGETGMGNAGITRLLTNGSVDTSFGDGGTYVLPASGSTVQGVFVSPFDARIVAVGWSHMAGMEVARFEPDGVPDTSFGNQGLVALSTSPHGTFGYDVAIQADRKIVAVATRGDALPTPKQDFVVARFCP